ncbi:hypothetical protein [Actinophytocola sp.]|uniref:hypothetical protein n=1 Tax=Actinophytocola sp. TaxID=1872138 RepID=UPI002D7ED6C9|nr:hypothetical protein [Actinophytocola sp.]HET9138707.1 hypothetical protein [Actinophytocola sp.]HEU5110056.1 hypothetical protein [Micromonosporaceae bacterium]
MTTLTSRPAPVWLRELTDARAEYEEQLGWPVSLQVGRRDLVIVIGGALAAVGMPARLGARVRQELGIAMLCGPIVADPGRTWWTFLTKPVGVVRPDVAHDLAALRVRIAPRGSNVEVPPSVGASGTSGWHWVERPQPTRPLPPGAVVVATVRRLTWDAGQLAA